MDWHLKDRSTAIKNKFFYYERCLPSPYGPSAQPRSAPRGASAALHAAPPHVSGPATNKNKHAPQQHTNTHTSPSNHQHSPPHSPTKNTTTTQTVIIVRLRNNSNKADKVNSSNKVGKTKRAQTYAPPWQPPHPCPTPSLRPLPPSPSCRSALPPPPPLFTSDSLYITHHVTNSLCQRLAWQPRQLVQQTLSVEEEGGEGEEGRGTHDKGEETKTK